MSRTFLIASLVAAGFGSRDPLAPDVLKATTATDDRGGGTTLFETFRQDHSITLADHRSHRSHSSHSSHRSGSGGHYSHSSHSSHTSHRSSTGGGGTYSPAPAPVYSPPSSSGSSDDSSGSTYRGSTPSTLYGSPDASATSAAPLKALPGRSELFKTIVKRVQIALLAHGVFSGTIDGDVGPATRKALRAYQTKYALKQTGTITPETLDSLKISSNP
ncbi:MAG: peptidoglycan-binding protein [Sphingomonas sp.]|uniref:peptidoglycan-binding protein n=1 Tax=Sphingomonas sp. TaxID=28214 RepID=UPI00262D9CB5|nr:peptidoglycan-binding protein [Sphingomonas sp.]MDK2770380.1 peptidoglycan-binding protein [Sphingomonas sp.]